MSQPSNQLKISARNAGQVELDKYCPRCCWYLLHHKNIPFRMGMPGIMFYLEAIQKAFILAHFTESEPFCGSLSMISKCTGPVDFPFSSSFEHKETGVLVTAQPDMMLRNPDGSIFLLDLKTSKPRGGGKIFLPQYEIQLIGYSWVTENNGVGKVSKAGLIYSSVDIDEFMKEPLGFIVNRGVYVPFELITHAVTLDYARFFACLEEVNAVWRSARPPEGKGGCKDCALLTSLCDFESGLRLTDQRAAAEFRGRALYTIQQDHYRNETRYLGLPDKQDSLSSESWDQDGGMWANWQFNE